MAFIVATKRGPFEVRESRSTPKGPRARTLASFRELDEETVAAVQARAVKPPTYEELREAALKVGAPVASPPADKAARQLIAALAEGHPLDPTLRDLVIDLLGNGGRQSGSAKLSDSARSAAAWIDTTPKERGRALFDLLLLADAIPARMQRSEAPDFPRLDSTRHG
ncbi:MAG TPA: hypothetical protein VIT85_02375 [Solirubrobacterales bacterium]